MTTIKNHFNKHDIARIFGEERYRMGRHPKNEPLAPRTIETLAHRWRNDDARKAHLRNPNSDPNKAIYDNNPPVLPLPNKESPQRLRWEPAPGETLYELEERLRAWYRNQPGRTGRPIGSVGTGGDIQQRANRVERVKRALEILETDTAADLDQGGLFETARLRLDHPQATNGALAVLAETTGGAVASRLSKLIKLADDRARELGIPDTNHHNETGDQS